MWIDALCIQQGRGGDWHAEAQAMDAIYTNAAVTIALVDGTGLDELARVRETSFISNPQALGRMLSDVSSQTDPELGTSSPSQEEVCRALSATGNFISRPSGVLDSRAWAFQEKLLSRRIISITREGLFWDCLHHSACDRRPLGIQGDHSPDFRDSDDRKVKRLLLDTPQPLFVGSGVGPHASPCASRPELLWHWRRILQQYTKRSLTYQTDRLLAVDGVMRRMGQILLDENVLGICRTDAIRCLLWFEEPRSDVLRRILSNEPAAPDYSLQRAARSHTGYLQPLREIGFGVGKANLLRAKNKVAAITGRLSLHSRSESTVSINTDAISRRLIAPSWSWAGVANPIQYRLWHPHNCNQDSPRELFTELAVVESMHAQRSDDRPFGSYEGLLVLEGHSVNCFIHDANVYAYHSWYVPLERAGDDLVNREELLAELEHGDSYALDPERVLKSLDDARANLGPEENVNWYLFMVWFASRAHRDGSITESTPLLADDTEGYLEKRRAHQREHETRQLQGARSWPLMRSPVDRMAILRFEFLRDHFEGRLARDNPQERVEQEAAVNATVTATDSEETAGEEKKKMSAAEEAPVPADGQRNMKPHSNHHKYEMARLLVLGRGGYDGVHMGQYCLVLRQVGSRWKRIGICVFDAQKCCLQDPRRCHKCIPTGGIKPCLGHWDRFEIE
ncbi:hypothetical protein MAPG_12032 [Magnaporthiopsis poae ATCC 64411]|uniref:Heterokaryon incompatibility domain-containing protein n=1 Tax=Magnaporthiopsis poae (strain ATCC 64411 / 73-15) TaxID=644358 RepID=A0A0C4EGP8_MAGP6|nr:hypothetical protein MAPG_12032 [Magnaporthiopsis poae ATCC 64411]